VYEALAEELGERLPIGLRMAVEEAPEHDVYTSRFGIARPAIEELAGNRLAGHPGLELRMLHFYLQTGIKDSSYYWIELEKAAELYAKLRLQHPTLTALNIGGGLPYRDSLVFDFDYEAITAKILTVIRGVCEAMGVPLPAIVTEFGAYTVAEASGMIFRVLHRKVQNDRETWLMLDGSLITALPDTWALGRRFLLLPVNHWDRSPERVVLGGLTCDSQDYYARDAHHDNLYLPHAGGTEPLYLGFFHTGAYQQALAGEGGAHHCLVPDPPQLVLDADETGACFERAYRPAQRAEDILPLLGFGQGRGSNCQDYHPDRP